MILITGFEAFDGRTCNGSATVASHLNGLTIGNETIESEIVPVLWTEIELFCRTRMTDSNATMIIGFGEADCPRPRLERLARPHCVGIDNSGRSAPVTDSDAVPIACEHLTCEASWFEGLNEFVDVSDDAGAYLCNWYLLHALKHATVPAGFVHVPIQRDVTDKDYLKALAPCVERFIDMNLKQIKAD